MNNKPIVSFRKRLIESVTPYKVNKESYLKRGSAIAQSHKEDHLFEHMFEIVLCEDYEDEYDDLRNRDWEDMRKGGTGRTTLDIMDGPPKIKHGGKKQNRR